MFYFDLYVDFQIDVETEVLSTEAETLVPSETSASGTYNNTMLILSVLQLFVLMIIALFTIVRRTNND